MDSLATAYQRWDFLKHWQHHVSRGHLLQADMVGFLALYAAAVYFTLALRGPLRDAAKA